MVRMVQTEGTWVEQEENNNNNNNSKNDMNFSKFKAVILGTIVLSSSLVTMIVMMGGDPRARVRELIVQQQKEHAQAVGHAALIRTDFLLHQEDERQQQHRVHQIKSECESKERLRLSSSSSSYPDTTDTDTDTDTPTAVDNNTEKKQESFVSHDDNLDHRYHHNHNHNNNHNHHDTTQRSVIDDRTTTTTTGLPKQQQNQEQEQGMIYSFLDIILMILTFIIYLTSCLQYAADFGVKHYLEVSLWITVLFFIGSKTFKYCGGNYNAETTNFQDGKDNKDGIKKPPRNGNNDDDDKFEEELRRESLIRSGSGKQQRMVYQDDDNFVEQLCRESLSRSTQSSRPRHIAKATTPRRCSVGSGSGGGDGDGDGDTPHPSSKREARAAVRDKQRLEEADGSRSTQSPRPRHIVKTTAPRRSGGGGSGGGNTPHPSSKKQQGRANAKKWAEEVDKKKIDDVKNKRLLLEVARAGTVNSAIGNHKRDTTSTNTDTSNSNNNNKKILKQQAKALKIQQARAKAKKFAEVDQKRIADAIAKKNQNW
mmetsp:Transcript_56418/g.63093  ORF Transcript_56418/g.63093 Transcript_56418/m.63093 type:complete len:538 (+) Transcript_56418:175-1788(+)